MLFRNRVRDTAQELLIAANTLAGSKVFTTRIQPVSKPEPPLLMVFSPRDGGDSLGPAGIPKFRMIMMLVLQVMVSQATDEDCGRELDELCEQAVHALLCSPKFLTIRSDQGGRAIEEVKSLHTVTAVKMDGDRFLGQAEIQIALQYKDAYALPPGVPLAEVTVTGDALNLFSPTGEFSDVANAGFPNAKVTPSPRKSGPDGRAEISFVIPFQDQDPKKG